MRLRVVIPGPPVGKQRARRGRGGRFYTPPKTRRWERSARDFAREAARVNGWTVERHDRIAVAVEAVKARPANRPASVSPDEWRAGGRVPRTAKPDADNVAKAVLDALEKAGVVVNDAQVVETRARSWYAADGEGPCVEVVVARL